MKKLLSLLMVLTVLLTAGCQKVSTLLEPKEEAKQDEPVVVPTQIPQVPVTEEESVTKIALSQELKMTNDWTILGSYNYFLTSQEKKDRLIIGTSAENKNGEMQWDDAQYWTVAVISEDGAYNLFFRRMQGRVYAELNVCYINGIATPLVTIYVFSGNDREVRNYIYDGEFFVESIEYTTKNFSTGGINNMYGTIPEYKPL